MALTRLQRWAALAASVVLALPLLAWGALALWLPSDAEIAARIASTFEQRTGIGLTIGRLRWRLQPQPAMTLSELSTQQKPPISARDISLRLSWRALLQGELQVTQIEVAGMLLPRASVRAFRGDSDPGQDGASSAKSRQSDATDALKAGSKFGNWTVAAVPVEQLRFNDVRWIDRSGTTLAYDGRIDFDAGWRPRRAEIWRSDVAPPVRLTLERLPDTHSTPSKADAAERWKTLVEAGGGSWKGTSLLRVSDAGHLRLTAQLDARQIDLTQLVTAFERRSVIEGRLAGLSELHAEGATAGELLRSLHTRTRFSVQPATLKGFDLARAVRSAGISRNGQTPLEELVGTLDTQATDNGTELRFTGLKARSGLLTATGNVSVLNGKLSGDAAVDLVDGIIGVPLKLSGTTKSPALSMTGAALTGATIGTALLPGVGTAIGARLGQQVERLFGGDKEPKRPGR